MSFPRFKSRKIDRRVATVATVATFPILSASVPESVADVATVAGVPPLISEWRAAIARVGTDQLDIAKLKTVSLRFLDTPDAVAAIENDWDEIALFGVHEGPSPKERLDTWGLVPFLAWGVHRYTIATVSRDACVLKTSRGASLRQPRMRANFGKAVPWWTHPGINREGGCHEGN